MIRTSTLTFSHTDDVGGDAVTLRFAPQRSFPYRAGQHALWAVPGGGMAPFTMSSAPEEELIALGTRLGSQSRMKRALAAIEPGDTVRVVGPLSSFGLDPENARTVMLAQGIGVTPFRSMLTSAALSGNRSRTTLLHVAAEHPFRSDTERAATQSHYPTSSDDFAEQVRAVVLEQADAVFMLSGARGFVASTSTLLRELGVARRQVRRDVFYGLPSPRTSAGRRSETGTPRA